MRKVKFKMFSDNPRTIIFVGVAQATNAFPLVGDLSQISHNRTGAQFPAINLGAIRPASRQNARKLTARHR